MKKFIPINPHRLIPRLRRMFIIVIAIVAVLFFIQVKLYHIPKDNDAMEPIFPRDKSVLCDRLYNWHKGLVPRFSPDYTGLKLKDVVVFTKKYGGKNFQSISRIVAVSGDKIQIRSGLIVIKNKKNKFKPKEIRVPGNINISFTSDIKIDQETGDIIIPKGKFYLLNNNLNSRVPDSRQFGFIERKNIDYRVIVRLSP